MSLEATKEYLKYSHRIVLHSITDEILRDRIILLIFS